MCRHADERPNGRREFLGLAVAGSVAGLGSLLAVGRAAGQEPAKVGKEAVEKLIADWPAKPKEVAKKMVEQYGQPNEATPTHLVWLKNGPWKYTILFSEEVPHNFPMKHTDVLEQVIDYKVPPDKFDELAAYDGSVTVRRTKGEMSAMCDKEEMNYLALNLANDIVTGKMGVEEARKFYGKVAMAFMKGEKHEYTQKLVFHQAAKGGTADPDEPLKKE
jgi:hypothetical protein